MLTVPLSVVANLVTGWVRNLWAERSLKSAEERLEKLRVKFVEEQTKYPAMTAFQDRVLAGLIVLLYVAGTIVGVLGLTNGNIKEVVMERATRQLVISVGVALAQLVNLAVLIYTTDFYMKHSHLLRTSMVKEMIKLEKKLGKEQSF